MVDKFFRSCRALFNHFVSGCSICSGFVRHLVETLVQILKGVVSHKKS